MVVVAAGLGVGLLAVFFLEASPTPLSATRLFQTNLVRQLAEPYAEQPVPIPDSLFQRVEYAGAKGKLFAFVSRPKDEKVRGPAMVWLKGGFPPGSLLDGAWLPKDPMNDQSGSQFMREGIVTMFPTTRGMEGNAGFQESFFGEIEDVVEAVKWLRAQPYVDPEHVYVGGHSTGGTLALLVGASTPVAGVLALGPVDDVCLYGQDVLMFDARMKKECAVRSPLTYSVAFANSVIVEGEWGNADAVRNLKAYPATNASYVIIPRDDHFFHIAAVNEFIAKKLAKGERLSLTVEEAERALQEKFPSRRVDEDDGWSVTVPAGWAEREREHEPDAPYVFKRAQMLLFVTNEKGPPVPCSAANSVPDPKHDGQCFQRLQQKTRNGSMVVALTAQPGDSIAISTSGPAVLEKELTEELSRVLDSVKKNP